MSRIIFAIIPAYFFITGIFSQWQQFGTGTNAKINSIYFVDNNTGFFAAETIFGSGNLFKTTNGGTNWIYIYSSTFPLKSIYFYDPQNGFAVGKEHILVTADGGNLWTDKYKPDYEIYDIRNFTSNYVLAVGFKMAQQNSAILQSYDGGNNWTSQIVYGGSTSRLLAVRFPNSNTGFTCGEYGTVMRLINGGSWHFQVTGTTNHLYSLYFFNSFTGFTAGANSTLVKTTNSGTNWTLKNTGFNNIDFRSVAFVDIATGFISGSNGFIARTTDSGENWVQQISNVNVNLNTLFCINKDTIFAAGENGVLLRTHNSGIIGININGNEIPSKFKLHQNYPNPFNPVTRINFQVPVSAYVKLAIYDELGREIEILIEDKLNPGEYFLNWNSSNIPSGIYFCKMTSNNYVQTIKMSVVK